ncbi:M43 family zinc metalloprotease [Candidatus Chloroploca sp. Khr17]|uniref:M43 family zinc metalloprotease n=1 Tax=Candidatus Chloroploca sp. Khr17 TaxID=2496869 RepID=UPI00101C0BE4|nr:M43 family zinc metalloprotease [Candidatus Chloroploca sp. Khr17]
MKPHLSHRLVTSVVALVVLLGVTVTLARPASYAQTDQSATWSLPPPRAHSHVAVTSDGAVSVDHQIFPDFASYFTSPFFRLTGKRCGTQVPDDLASLQASPGDCTLTRTAIQQAYWPNEVYVIPTVFHIIYASDGTGNLSDQRIQDQVRVLNEDYQALPGTAGAQGTNTRIHFQLVGITRTMNDAWFQDQDELAYKQALGWDQSRYLNVYVNTASGFLGYSYLPQQQVPSVYDGVVMLYQAIGGRDLPDAAPYDQGRTLVHEVGHYLGLLHTFEGGGCFDGYEAGDLLADTSSEDVEHYGCTPSMTCGTPDDIHNFMNYTDDTCMWRFTVEQANRLVCSLVNYRSTLYNIGAVAVNQTPPPDRVQAGQPLTYTLAVQNTGQVALDAQITNILPSATLTYTLAGESRPIVDGKLAWTTTITAPGGTWTETLVVTLPMTYTGTVTNVLEVTSQQGVTGAFTSVVTVGEAVRYQVFLPLAMR